MGVSRVDFDGETLIDLTDDTVTPQSLLSGYSAHNKAGELIEGLAVIPTKVSELKNDMKYLTDTGDSSKTTVTFEQAVKRANVNSGDDLSTAFSKLSKFCEDLKPHAFSTPVTNLFATVTGNSLDATMGKNLKDLHDANKNEINALNSKLDGLIRIEIASTNLSVQINPNNATTVKIAVPKITGYQATNLVSFRNATSGFYCSSININDSNIEITLVNGLVSVRDLYAVSCFVLFLRL